MTFGGRLVVVELGKVITTESFLSWTTSSWQVRRACHWLRCLHPHSLTSRWRTFYSYFFGIDLLRTTQFWIIFSTFRIDIESKSTVSNLFQKGWMRSPWAVRRLTLQRQSFVEVSRWQLLRILKVDLRAIMAARDPRLPREYLASNLKSTFSTHDYQYFEQVWPNYKVEIYNNRFLTIIKF